MDYDKTCQFLLLGDMAVGKTCLINRYTNGVFKEEYISTVGFDYYTKQVLWCLPLMLLNNGMFSAINQINLRLSFLYYFMKSILNDKSPYDRKNEVEA